MRRLLGRVVVFLSALLATLTLAGAVAYGSAKSPREVPAASHQGGSLTDLEAQGFLGTWTGFDPAITTSQSAFESEVYGGLFDLGPHETIVPDLATGYKLTDGGLTLTINLRHGVTFSNGDPFNASVVEFNIKRYLDPSLPNASLSIAGWPMSSVATPDNYTVVVHFSRVYAPIVYELAQSSFNDMLDPVALQKMGETAYNLTPIGAGPFTVSSDKPSANLVLKRNPHYWKAGYPKLDTLNVETVANDESAYEAIQAGQAQIYEGLGTLGLVAQAKKSSQVNLYTIPATSPYVLQLNTSKPPFNNLEAREALYYATDSASINKHIFGNHYSLTQSPTGPGGLFYEPKVPGYRTYDLAKAKSLVKQLGGGMNISLGTIALQLAQETDEALQSQWAQAGIHTSLTQLNLTSLIGQFRSGDWNVMLQEAGAYDPALVLGIGFRFGSTSPFTGVHDPKLDSMMNQAEATFDKAQRAADYKQVFKYISDQAYAIFMFNVPTWDIAKKNVTGLSQLPDVGFINWTNVGLK
jgi:peptide/nickel transport system substrate-binding protein